MTETSVIKHYKKQLIHRQHDLPEDITSTRNNIHNSSDRLENEEMFDTAEAIKNSYKSTNNCKKTRKKRKNRNCRGQFRHEAMELIKLGTNSSQTLFKTKEPTNLINEKPVQLSKEVIASIQMKIQEGARHKHNLLQKSMVVNFSSAYGHPLPQMVPERHKQNDIPSSKQHSSSSLLYQTLQPEYKVPVQSPFNFHLQPYPPPSYSLPRPGSPAFNHPSHSPIYSPTRLHSPSYTPPYTPPRQPIIRPIAQPAPITGIHFSSPYSNGYRPPVVPHFNPTNLSQKEYPEKKKLKPNNYSVIVENEPQIVAAIDLTIDVKKVVPQEAAEHECKCECGKMYSNDSILKEAMMKGIDKDAKRLSQVPRDYSNKERVIGKDLSVIKLCTSTPSCQPVRSLKDNKIKDAKPSHLFLIEDLLAKKEKVVETRNRIYDIKNNNNNRTEKALSRNVIVPIRTEPNRVIVSDNQKPNPQPKDHSVSSIIGNRRQSVEIDTISISSSGSETVRSPRPKSTNSEKHQIPQGKLYYYKNNNSFIRYFDDAQKKLFLDNLIADGSGYELKQQGEKTAHDVIELPSHTMFSPKDNLSVEEYVTEMTLVEKYIPKDFFLFYKFVTGYQICNNNSPVSFLTFLKMYNTNGLKSLLERYVNSLKL